MGWNHQLVKDLCAVPRTCHMSSRQPPDNPKHLLKRRTHGKSHIQHLVVYTLRPIKTPEQGPKITDLLCSGFTGGKWDQMGPSETHLLYMFLVTTVVTRIFSNDSLLVAYPFFPNFTAEAKERKAAEEKNKRCHWGMFWVELRFLR